MMEQEDKLTEAISNALAKCLTNPIWVKEFGSILVNNGLNKLGEEFLNFADRLEALGYDW